MAITDPMVLISGPVFDAGSAVSNVVSLGNATAYIILMPDDWTQPGNIKCAYSPDSTNFYQLYVSGKEWVSPCIPNAAMVIDNRMWPKGSFFRFTSTFGGEPVNQEAERVFKIVTE